MTFSNLPGSRAGITRRRFLLQAGAGAAAGLAPAILRGATRSIRPNVLFISVDDMCTDIDVFGGRARTPHLNRLAAAGTRFERAYCQFPWCGPSRASLLTGFRPDQTRVFDLNYFFRQEMPDVVTLPQCFMQHGYYVARVGKIYHAGNPGQIGQDGLDDPASWMERINPVGRDKQALLSRVINYTPGHPGLGSSLAYWEDPTGREEDYTDGQVASNAIRLLEQHRQEPFFLGVGFYKPHCPFIAPKRYFDLYPESSLPLPSVPAGYRHQVPEAALASTGPWPWFGATAEQSRACQRGYYAAISFVDAQIGRVLGALDRLGLRESTVVVFWADHGYHTGDHGLWFKQSLFESAARVPMIVSAPKGLGRGQVCSSPVEHIDLYPTLTDLCGLELPSGRPGRSLRPFMTNPSAISERAAFTQVERADFPGWSVRNRRWRFTAWDEGRRGEELYDHENDPTETRNLAADSAYRPVVENMRRLMKANWPTRVVGGVMPGGKPGGPAS